MSRYYRRRRSYGYSGRSAGHEAARKHIREAHELSRELGGTDEDVKKYFFSLSQKKMKEILDEYGREYGEAARAYAQNTLPSWKARTVHMSGQTAARLFKLLPRRMPLKKKYALVESLWTKFSPRSQYSIVFGPNATFQQIREKLAAHLEKVVMEYRVPDPLQNRFKWLSDGDSTCVQEMLNHFLMRDRVLATDAVEAQTALILEHLNSEGSALQKYKREVHVGGHEVNIVLNPKADDVRLIPGSWRATTPDRSGIGCFILVVIVVALFILFRVFGN